jgi:hypothetical protein
MDREGIQAMNDDPALEQRFVDRAKALSNVAKTLHEKAQTNAGVCGLLPVNRGDS